MQTLSQIRNVASDASDVAADRRYGVFKFLLATTSNRNVGPLTDEEFCRGDTDALSTAGHDSHFPLQFLLVA